MNVNDLIYIVGLKELRIQELESDVKVLTTNNDTLTKQLAETKNPETKKPVLIDVSKKEEVKP